MQIMWMLLDIPHASTAAQILLIWHLICVSMDTTPCTDVDDRYLMYTLKWMYDCVVNINTSTAHNTMIAKSKEFTMILVSSLQCADHSKKTTSQWHLCDNDYLFFSSFICFRNAAPVCKKSYVVNVLILYPNTQDPISKLPNFPIVI